jgi:hypothetical protein
MKSVEELEAQSRLSARKASHAMDKALAFAELVKPGDPPQDAEFVSRKMREAQRLDGLARKDALALAQAKIRKVRK